MQEKYFAASNSSEGFCSYYENVFDMRNLNRIYAIKGGSGTGKAFFMKEIARCAENRGLSVRYIYCSSDPDSLDGIIIKEPGIAILDGTFPHIYEPRLVGAVDSIVDLGSFLDNMKLAKNRYLIEEIGAKKQAGFVRAYRYLTVYHKLSSNIEDIVAPCINIEKIKRFVQRLLNKIPNSDGKEEHLLVNSIGMRGISHFDTYFDKASIYYSINDCLDSAHILIKEVYSLMKSKGASLRISNNPIIKTRIDAICEINSGLTLEIDGKMNDSARIVNMKRFIYDDKMINIKSKYREIDRQRKDILSLALKELEEIKKYHFELEEIYGSAMNFEEKEIFTHEFCNKIFERN